MVKNNTLHYLGINHEIDENLNTLIDTCIEEVKEIANPQFMVQKYKLSKDPLRIEELNLSLNYSDLETILKDCDECLFVACTLGIQIDQKIRYYAISDISKMSVFDAASSAYIEEVCDHFEDKLNLKKRTMRFCPGYGNVPISLNTQIAGILSCDKHIGLHVHNDLLLPQKSVIGIIGIGCDNPIKSCGHCIRIKECEYRKKGTRCYLID